MLDLQQDYEELKEAINKFDEEKEKLNNMQYDPTKCSILLNGVEIGASVDFKVYPSTPKVIILNAPASCGKDVTAEYLVENLENTAHCEFKGQLFKLTKLIYQVSDKLWDSLYTRELKEVPSTYLEGLSPRQALIKVSEGVIKPNYGKDYFGKAALKQALNSHNNFGSNLCVFSDGGFIEELKPMLDYLGKDNILIVRIHREGYTFEGDSRNYLPDSDDYNTINIYNNGTLEELFLKAKSIVGEFVGDKS